MERGKGGVCTLYNARVKRKKERKEEKDLYPSFPCLTPPSFSSSDLLNSGHRGLGTLLIVFVT